METWPISRIFPQTMATTLASDFMEAAERVWHGQPPAESITVCEDF